MQRLVLLECLAQDGRLTQRQPPLWGNKKECVVSANPARLLGSGMWGSRSPAFELNVTYPFHTIGLDWATHGTHTPTIPFALLGQQTSVFSGFGSVDTLPTTATTLSHNDCAVLV